jgi:hypothetical protein
LRRPFAQAPHERYSNPGVTALDDLRLFARRERVARSSSQFHASLRLSTVVIAIACPWP